jgi:hypothetical protein
MNFREQSTYFVTSLFGIFLIPCATRPAPLLFLRTGLCFATRDLYFSNPRRSKLTLRRYISRKGWQVVSSRGKHDGCIIWPLSVADFDAFPFWEAEFCPKAGYVRWFGVKIPSGGITSDMHIIFTGPGFWSRLHKIEIRSHKPQG